ncbi:hypothetical protein CYMTET_16130 [Cymbomonas tetramitiformis]|uniref:CMP/dCMP-type deaminase domain-containing protein n=1 Tax=Cymbomonas tetramitiformis TaxID=36881 RepID=A0AAE0GCZ4_9CHLO|nr:hypothetical protein CYMTET_16130 [Cymbomonas tetramitiformis]
MAEASGEKSNKRKADEITGNKDSSPPTVKREPAIQDLEFLSIAVEEGYSGVKAGDGGPFGCVIVKDGKVVGRGHNEVLKNKDPTCHAEITAIQKACKHLGIIDLAGCEMYSSCEPCPMSFGAIYLSRRLVYGAEAEQAVDQGFDESNIGDAIRGTATFQKTECVVEKLESAAVAELFASTKKKYLVY